jgi:threonine dehydrogenase-like Zn-dependent dehydrogenase
LQYSLKHTSSSSAAAAAAAASLPRSHLQRLIDLVAAGRLQVALDSSRRFVGLESVPEAVDWLQSGKSSGKVVVQLSKELPGTAPAAGASRL